MQEQIVTKSQPQPIGKTFLIESSRFPSFTGVLSSLWWQYKESWVKNTSTYGRPIASFSWSLLIPQWCGSWEHTNTFTAIMKKTDAYQLCFCHDPRWETPLVASCDYSSYPSRDPPARLDHRYIGDKTIHLQVSHSTEGSSTVNAMERRTEKKGYIKNQYIDRDRELTLSHSKGSPSSFLHPTHSWGGWTSIGCLGKSEYLSLGFASSRVVFWPAAIL